MRFFDCFPFFNELDLLEIRLNELANVVDYFIIVEARQTFSGKPKKLCFMENIERFSSFTDQIVHLVIEDFPVSRSKWGKERFQREHLLNGLSMANAEDLVMLSDVVEIPRREVLRKVISQPPNYSEVLCLELRWFNYFLNLERSEPWVRIGPRILRKASVTSMSALRTNVRAPVSGMRDHLRKLRANIAMRQNVTRRVVEDAGWHFSWLGGVQSVSQKAGSIPKHVNRSFELEDPEKARNAINSAVRSSACGGYSIVEIDESFPVSITMNIDLYRHLIYDPANPLCTGTPRQTN